MNVSVLGECGSGFNRPMRERHVCGMDEAGLETGKDFPSVGLIEFDEWHSQRFLSVATHCHDETSVFCQQTASGCDSSLNWPNLGRLRRNAIMHWRIGV